MIDPAFTAMTEPKPADLIITSQAVFTALQDHPEPLSVAIRGDRIVWVGAPDQLPAQLIGPHTERQDFGDALVMPGFHDAHLHYFHSALYYSPLAERFCGTSEADAVARLAPLARRRPEGAWLMAQGWRDYLWDPPITPTKASLDAAYPGHPVALYSGDAHTLWLNSRALEELGITAESTAPAGGSYDKSENGELTGIVREAAAMELMTRIVAGFSDAELLDAYREFARHLNRHGITAACDMSLMAHPGLDFVRDDLFQQLLDQGDLTVRMTLFPTLLDDQSRMDRLEERLDNPLLRVGGFKQFFDGVSSQHTAWLHDPYCGERVGSGSEGGEDGEGGGEPDCGRPTVPPERMEALVEQAVEHGHPVRIHAIGDEAIHQAVRIFAEHPAGERADGTAQHHTIEHLENFQPADIQRLADAGIVASVQPRHMTLDPGGPERDLGAERVPYMWPFRQLLDAGATLAFGTDSPVTAIDPMDAVYTAVTRRDADTHEPPEGWLPAEKITLAEALRAYTLGSATAAQRAHEMGSLEPGKLADLVVLAPNPFELPPEDLQQASVVATYTGGREVFRA